MPTGYSTTDPGVDEARLDAIKAVLVAKIADLDTSLGRAPLSMPANTATAANLMIGDPEIWPSSAGLAFLVCITGGGKHDGLDLESEFRYVGVPVTVSSLEDTLHTNIAVYIHPDSFPAADTSWSSVQSQCEKRERLLSRVCDWIRADVMATVAGIDLTLASKETSESGDNLTMGRVASIRKGKFDKSFGGQWGVLGAHLQIVHTRN